jgi:hypothetical protein
MIDTKNLEDIIKLTLYTGYIKNEKPVSLMVIAKPETGKTQTMLKFMVNKGVAFLTDVTAFGITRDLLPRIKSGEIRHLIIPDMVKPLSRSGKVVMNFIAFANALIEEGIITLSSYASHEEFKVPVKCGIIGAVIKEDLFKKLDYWGTIGFISRFIPFSYDYAIDSVQKIFEYIIKGDYTKEDPIKIKTFKQDKDISISPQQARKLIPLAQEIGRKQKLFGFRALRDLKVLAKASALERGKDKVSDYDIKRILKLGRWMNLDFNPLSD